MTSDTHLPAARLVPAIFLVCAVLPFSAMAQGPAPDSLGTPENPYVVPHTDSDLTIDAILDEPAWEDALALDVNVEVRPGENVRAPVTTVVLLTYDEDNLYAGFRCFDPDPSAIRAHLRDRDRIGGDDWVALILDTFNDERRSFDFIVTARGVQYDGIESPNYEDSGWDAIWKSAGRITDWGYAVEIAVPFSSLRFQRTEGTQIWGFDAVRRYPRDVPHHIGAFPRDRNNSCYLCQAIKIEGFEGASPGRNIEVSPTLIAFRNEVREDLPNGDMEKESQRAEPGITARWGITPNLNFNFTANPDFSQVEADALQLDINEPFALSYPERRPFFTEGAEFFNTLKRIVYTRTMRDPTAGLKLTGKEGAHTIGAYVVRDDVTNLIFPGSQSSSSQSLDEPNTSSVLRYKRDFGSHYTAGLLATDREASDYFNRVYGFDLDFRLTPTHQVQLLVLGSSTQYPEPVAEEQEQPSETLNGRLISFEYDHYTRTWGWWADFEEAGSDFRADLGYFPRVGYLNAEGGLLRTWIANPGQWWSQLRAGTEFYYFDEQGGGLLGRGGEVWLSYSGMRQSQGFVELERSREAYGGKEFDLTDAMLEFSLWPSRDLQAGVFVVLGDRIDYANTRLGKVIRFSPSLDYNLGDHIRLSSDFTIERMSVHNDRLYTANIAELRAVYQFTIRAFVRLTIQYVDYDYNASNYLDDQEPVYRRLYSEALFNYRINPRTVLFVGYSDAYNGAVDYDLTQSTRKFFAKVGYAWVL